MIQDFINKKNIDNLEESFFFFILFQMNFENNNLFKDMFKKIDFNKWKIDLLNENDNYMKRGYFEIFYIFFKKKNIISKDKSNLFFSLYKNLLKMFSDKNILNERKEFDFLYSTDRDLYNAYLVLFIYNSFQNKNNLEKILFLFEFIKEKFNNKLIKKYMKFIFIYEILYYSSFFINLNQSGINLNKILFKDFDLQKYCKFFEVDILINKVTCIKELILLNIFIFLELSKLKYNKKIEKKEKLEIREQNFIQEKLQNFFVVNLSDEIKDIKEYCFNLKEKKIPYIIIRLENSFRNFPLEKFFDKMSDIFYQEHFLYLWSFISFKNKKYDIAYRKFYDILNFKTETNNYEDILLVYRYLIYIHFYIYGNYEKSIQLANINLGQFDHIKNEKFLKQNRIPFILDIVDNLIKKAQMENFIENKQKYLEQAYHLFNKVDLEKIKYSVTDLIFYYAKILILKKNMEKAKRIIKRYLKINPNTECLYYLYFYIFFSEKNMKKSSKILDILKNLTKVNPFVYLLM